MKLLSIDVPGGKIGGYCTESDAGALSYGTIEFLPSMSEADCFRYLDRLLVVEKPDLVILEQPFLYIIARWIGGVQCAAALRGIPWFSIGASRCKKLIMNHGRASKKEVLDYVKNIIRDSTISQHIADSWLYLEAWKKITAYKLPEVVREQN